MWGPEKPRRGLREGLRLGGGAGPVRDKGCEEEAAADGAGRVKVPTEEARCFGSGGTTTAGGGAGG